MFKRALASSFIALLIALPCVAQTGASGASPGKTESPKATPMADSRLIVGLKPGVTEEQATALWKAVNVKLIEKVANLPSYVVGVPPGRLDRVEKDLKARPEVEYVERDVKRGPATKK